MAVIVGLGNDSITAAAGVANSGEFYTLSAGYTATGDASVTSLHAHIDSVTTASNLKIAILDSSGNILRITGSLSLSGVPVEVSESVTSLSVTNGTKYFLAIIGDGYFYPSYSGSTGWITDKDSSGTYASPPDPMTFGTQASEFGTLTAWADGSAGGGLSIPVAMNQLRTQGIS